MKITKTQLKQIIKEEVSKVIQEADFADAVDHAGSSTKGLDQFVRMAQGADFHIEFWPQVKDHEAFAKSVIKFIGRQDILDQLAAQEADPKTRNPYKAHKQKMANKGKEL